MAIVYVVTHGDKHSGPNPGLTAKGIAEVSTLRKYLPEVIDEVVCGTGHRHMGTADALKIGWTRVTACVGGPESLEYIDAEYVVILADGTHIHRDMYTTPEDGKASALELVGSLKNESVICAGRPLMIMLGLPEVEAKSAAVYRVGVGKTTQIIPVKRIYYQLNITLIGHSSSSSPELRTV